MEILVILFLLLIAAGVYGYRHPESLKQKDSDLSDYHKSKQISKTISKQYAQAPIYSDFVVIDFETTGLSPSNSTFCWFCFSCNCLLYNYSKGGSFR